MRVSLQPAYILHRRPYRNTSWLLEVITLEFGMLGLVAKGVRTQKSEKRALLEPFTKLSIGFSGRGDLMTLTAVEAIIPSSRFESTALYSGMYMNELLCRLLHRHDPHEAIFNCYEQAITALAKPDTQLEPALRKFEITLLQELGYGLQLQYEAETGQAIRPDSMYCYDMENGPMLANAEPKQGLLTTGKCLIALANHTFDDPSIWPEMKKLMRHVIHYHLDGRVLKSRELFNGYDYE